MIKNIQSHKETILEFSKGINVIVGSSNNGKSAILRALYWLRYNRPLGTDNLLSHWAYDKKGNQKDEMLVTLENESGKVVRRRTKPENQYIVNDQELNVVKSDVPEEVESILSLSDTNIQKQLDSPFLLSLSAGQVAQYFNKTVRLDVIDRVLSNAELKRRRLNQEIKLNEDSVQDLQKKHDKFSWLENAEKLITKYKNLQNKNCELEEEIEILTQELNKYEKYSEVKDKYNFISDSQELIQKVKKLNEKNKNLSGVISDINDNLESFNSYNKKNYDFTIQKKIIEKIKNLNTKELKNQICELQEQIENYEDNNSLLKISSSEIKNLKKELPEICPLCGGSMKKYKEGEYDKKHG